MDNWFNNIFILNGQPMTQKQFSDWHKKKVAGGPIGNHTLEVLTPAEFKRQYPDTKIYGGSDEL